MSKLSAVGLALVIVVYPSSLWANAPVNNQINGSNDRSILLSQLPKTSMGLKFPESWRRDGKSQDKIAQKPPIIIERPPRPVSPTPPVVLDPLTGQPMRFRVVVPTSSDNDLARIRTVIPDAFRVYRGGQMVVQIGAYSDRSDAEAQASKVAPLGYQANIVDF
jgi:hypothetical protein